MRDTDNTKILNEEAEAGKRKEAEAILAHCSVEGVPHLYVLGSYEGRVTIHSQQIRAFNLVYALKTLGKLEKGKNGELQVAVIGGGIGGLTAAVAAARMQVAVTIFERHSELLHNLRGCHTRHLHPNIYDWPQESAAKPNTDLPFLNWSAASADSVASHMLKQWQDELSSRSRVIQVRNSVQVCIRNCLPEGKRRITVMSHPYEELEFDVVILAVGFGVERHLPPQPLRSYWRDDSLHQPEIELRSERTHYLVSGNGDGGLIDLLRLRLKDFKQENLIEDFKLDEFGQADELREIENRIASVADPDRTIYEKYNELPAPVELDKLLLSRLRSDTTVTFNYSGWAFSHRSSVLHRYLVFRLLRIDPNTVVQPGALIALDGHEPDLVAQFKVDGEEKTRRFHRAVVRHGPHSALERDFPFLHAKFRDTLGPRNALDATRRPCWPKGFFDDGDASANSNMVAPTGSEEQQVSTSPAAPLAASPATAVSNEAKSSETAVSNQAIQLRDELRKGEAQALASKFSLLTSEEQNWLLTQVWQAALSDDNALNGLKQLLSCFQVYKDANIAEMLTRLLREAVFKASTARKESILGLGTQYLSLVDNKVLEGFCDGLIDVVLRDQYVEVNVIMPALAAVQDAIPPSLHEKYVDALLLQSRSLARRGAPAARSALLSMPEQMVAILFRKIDADWLMAQYELKEILDKIFERHMVLVPEPKRKLVEDYVNSEYVDFMSQYLQRKAE